MAMFPLLRQSSTAGRIRPYLLMVALLGAVAILLHETNAHEKIGQWLFWTYAGLWGLTLFWALSCLSLGHVVLAVTSLCLRPRERLLFDFAVGTLLFAIVLFLVGLLGGLRGPFYYLFPLSLTAIGAPGLLAYGRRVGRHWCWLRQRARLKRSALRVLAIVFGTLGLTLVYIGVMLPDSVSFDALTYHLSLAEGWAAGGRIGISHEGWFMGTIPHLASWLYTWAFTVTPLSLTMKVLLAAHMEFFLFLATLMATPLLVEALCPGRRAGLTWVVYFLFPGLFLYDSSLGIAADHVLAFWAVPLALATRRTLGSWRPGRVFLLGLMMAASALTKYQALYLLVPVGLLLLVDGVRQLTRRRGTIVRFLLGGPVTLVLVSLLASAPHWLANVIWYGNPVYPMLGTLFPSRPWSPSWKGPIPDPGWTPEGPVLSRLLETTKAVFTFSFVPHDWPNYHGQVPVFGFLFTLSLLLLPFLRGCRRIWLLAGGTSLGVFLWYWTFHQDRYLQILLPWMVACTAAILMLAWSTGRLVRIATSLLVALQVIWGGDVPFLPAHVILGESPARRVSILMATTFQGQSETRFRKNWELAAIADSLPQDAVVLFHEEYIRLGMGRPVVGDSARWQGGIHYTDLMQPDRVYDRLKSYGVTHIVWESSQSPNLEIPVSGQLVFYDFVVHHGRDKRDFSRYSLVAMPSERPADAAEVALTVRCDEMMGGGGAAGSQQCGQRAGAAMRGRVHACRNAVGEVDICG